MKNISIKEKEYALNNAVASVEMEGYRISEYEKRLCMDALNGVITKDEFIKKLTLSQILEASDIVMQSQ